MFLKSVGFGLAIPRHQQHNLQLAVYPTVTAREGTLCSFRYAILFFPVAYSLATHLSIIASASPPPMQANGFLVWVGLCAVLFIQVGGTLTLPALAILINNSSTYPSALGHKACTWALGLWVGVGWHGGLLLGCGRVHSVKGIGVKFYCKDKRRMSMLRRSWTGLREVGRRREFE